MPSGYGEQTRVLSQYLNQEHDVAISAYYGLHGSTLEWNGMTIYPGGNRTYGQDVVERHAEHHFKGERGIILTVLDVWVFDGKEFADLPVASWSPQDHDPLPPVSINYFQESGAVPIALSRFGEKQLEAEGLRPLYAPHGVDTEVFKPLDRAECRASLSMKNDAFIVGMVAANQGYPSRKCFAEAFMAMGKFIKGRNDVYFYLHTDTSGLRQQGIDLVRLAAQCGIPGEKVIECDQYLYGNGFLSPNYMARAFNSIDVLLSPSMGEGFGIPIIESQACGTPVIATNHSAMQETAGVGWLVEGQDFYTGLQAWQKIPDVEQIVDCLTDAYIRADMLHDEAVEFAQQYEYGHVYDTYWKPVILEISERVRARQIMELEPV